MVSTVYGGINHDRDNNLTDGAELDVNDPFGADVADLSIESGMYSGFAGLVAIVIHSPPQMEGETANFWWNLHTQGQENWQGTIVLHYDESELNGIPESELGLNHYDGDEWVELDTVVDEEENTVTAIVNKDDFSPYALSRRQTPGSTDWDDFSHKQLEGNNINSVSRPITMSNYPNPFNPETTIEFTLPEAAKDVNLAIYDLAGKMVKSFIEGEQRSEGTYSVVWNGTNNTGETVSSGVYLYVLRTDTTTLMQRMTLLK
jgi:hypothetical protein